MKQALLFRKVKRLIDRAALIIILALWLWPTLALACSGERAPGLIEHNRSVVQIFAALSIILFVTTLVFYFLRHKKGLWVVIISLILVVFHPAWIYGGGGGDCGVSMASGAKFSAVLLGIGVAHQLRSWLVNRAPRCE